MFVRFSFKERQEKSIKAVNDNKENLSKWLNEDKDGLNLDVTIIDNLDKFQSSDFELNEEKNKRILSQIQEWSDIKLPENNETVINSSGQNMILKNKIIKLRGDDILLRSLSVECTVTLLMSGESNFYIFSRCDDKFSDKTVVCNISKELESARKFISFAVLEPMNEGKFIIKNLKKQEIPKQENYIKSLDISELKFTFIDNGDNKCLVFLEEQEQNSNLIIVGDFYMPIESKSNLMFAVSGDLVSLKKLRIKQTFRNSYIKHRNSGKNNINIQACNCCSVF